MIEAPTYATATFVTDPATGERLIVERDREYVALIGAFFDGQCQHTEKAVYRLRIANGAVQVRECCSACGQGFGSAMSQKDKAWVEALPWLPDELAESYDSRRFAEKQRMLVDLARKQYAERGAFTKSYSEYLTSPEWQTKRQLVLKRCGGTCEGCGVKPATEVHHWTYQHLFDELLFELYGLCHGCHERITQEKREREAAERKAKDAEAA